MASPVDETYTETKDLYLEILWQAQRVEDQRLVALIKERLRCVAGSKAAAVENCAQIIPFPALATGSLAVEGLPLAFEEPSLWPRRPTFQGVSIFSAYCATILFFLFLPQI